MDNTATAPQDTTPRQSGNPSETETSLSNLTDSFLAGELKFDGPVTIEEDPLNPGLGGKPAAEVNGGTPQGAVTGDRAQPAQPTQPTAPPAGGRNYKEVFGDSPVPKWAKEMSNDAWSNFVPAYQYYNAREVRAAERRQKEQERENKIKELENSRYYDIEEGWRVDPEFKKESEAVATAEAVRDHWADQLKNIEAGNKWAPAIKNEQGQWVTGPLQDPSIEGKVRVLSELTRANSLVENHRSNAERLSATFKERQREYYSGMEEMRTNLFSQYEKNLAPYRKAAIDMFPAIVRHKPEVQALADAIILIKLQGQVISKLKTQSPTINSQAAATNLQPSSTAGAETDGESRRKANVDRLARLANGIE